MTPKALLVSSDQTLESELRAALESLDLAFTRREAAGEIERALATSSIEVAFVDVSTADGLKRVAELTTRHPECAILAVTPAAQTAIGVQAARSGAADFVRRPLDVQELAYVSARCAKGSSTTPTSRRHPSRCPRRRR